MAQKKIILSVQCANIHALHNALEPLESISSSQFMAIKNGAAAYLPALVTIYQRSHKGTLSVQVNALTFGVTHRGKLGDKLIKLDT